MGQKPSKDQLLYQYASSGNVDKIKALRARGAEPKVMHPYFPFNTRASVVPASRPLPAEDDCSGNVDKIKARAQGAELEVMHPYFPFNTRASVVPASRPSLAEDVELAMAISASIQSAMESRPPYVDANPISEASTSSSSQSGRMRDHNEIQEVGPRGNTIQFLQNHNETPYSSLPSSPPIEDAVVDGCASSLCVICLVAPVEGACIPCGHMVGCMSCLNEIEGKKWSCPVCRIKITQVIRIYTG